jgi:hypothetical protein
MKKLNYQTKSILLGILVIGMVLPFTACAKKIRFLQSSVVPAAKGYVKVKTDNNNNYVIKIDISDLADVERLQTSKASYVVWMETDQERIENLGQLNSSSGFLSKQMKATLETVSSYKPTKIFITVEEFSDAQMPGEEIILTTDRF